MPEALQQLLALVRINFDLFKINLNTNPVSITCMSLQPFLGGFIVEAISLEKKLFKKIEKQLP